MQKKIKAKVPKIGDKIRMKFSLQGMASFETYKILHIDDYTVVIDEDGTDNSGLHVFRAFKRKTGECVNDNNMFGAKRSINPI